YASTRSAPTASISPARASRTITAVVNQPKATRAARARRHAAWTRRLAPFQARPARSAVTAYPALTARSALTAYPALTARLARPGGVGGGGPGGGRWRGWRPPRPPLTARPPPTARRGRR